MNKLERDARYGLEWRYHLIAILNTIFQDQLYFEFVHPSLKIDLAELRKKNTLLNRVAKKSVKEGVGFTIQAKHLELDKTLRFEVRKNDDPDLFLKKPGDVGVHEYINTIKNSYFFLVVNKNVEKIGLVAYHLSSIDDYDYNKSINPNNSARLSALRKGTGSSGPVVRPTSLKLILVQGGQKKDLIDPKRAGRSIKMRVLDLFDQ